jgi:hypothetical protein
MSEEASPSPVDSRRFEEPRDTGISLRRMQTPPSRNHIPLMELPTIHIDRMCTDTPSDPSTTAYELCVSHGQGIDTCLPRVHRPSVLSVIRPGSHLIVSRSSTTAQTASILANLAVSHLQVTDLARPESSLTGFEPVSPTPPDNDDSVHPIGVDRLCRRFPVRCSV